MRSHETSGRGPLPVEMPLRLASTRCTRRRPLGTRRRVAPPRIGEPVQEIGSGWTPVRTVPEFLEELYGLCSSERTNAAVDLVIDGVDDVLAANDVARCEDILQSADVLRLSVSVMLALLMETFRARKVVPARAEFYSRVDRRLRETLPSSKVDALLATLR
jgi:hypothetical protein